MDDDAFDKRKTERLEKQLEESNAIGSMILAMAIAIMISGLTSNFNPLVIGVLFFLIYGAIKLIK